MASAGRVDREADPLPALPEGFVRNRASDQAEGGRVVALVVDTLNARFEDVHFAIKGAISTLESIDPDDRVGLYVMNRLGAVAVHDFSDDREDLLQRLRSASNIPQLFDGIAIETPDNTTSLTVDRSHVEAEKFRARMQLLFTLRGLQGIAEHLAFIPGRKAMVWLSIGFNPSTMTDNLDLWNPAIERISAANVAVYGVDTMGLRTLTGFSAEYGPAHRPRSRHIRNMQPVQEMAGRTGGRTYMNTNNVGAAIREAIDDSEVVYTLAFTAREEQWNGAYRRIKVNVDRKGVEVRHREGYLARLPEATTEEESERLLTDTLLGSVHATGLPLRGRIERGERAERGETSTVLTLVIEPQGVVLRREQDRYRGECRIRVSTLNARGRSVEDFTDTITLSLDETEWQRAREEGLRYRRILPAARNASAVKVAVMNMVNGQLGSITLPVPKSPDEETPSRD